MHNSSDVITLSYFSQSVTKCLRLCENFIAFRIKFGTNIGQHVYSECHSDIVVVFNVVVFVNVAVVVEIVVKVVVDVVNVVVVNVVVVFVDDAVNIVVVV